ncbi:Transcription initiation factor IIB protein [Marine Group I thaumarchaeote SCGC AAA799-E16]|uniref:Transcription initiation factor IIB protein n=5 Tax=Marine Group I TaxID=905826 RepID=A0A087S849_9ARCH|nr:Transcription initiation factor IIB protein [Marine Group I thaumarchaeote SCGC AAA799-N04]KER06915.1 Transcription initiation factor IIB protein [Marine Group I thaumarchaeote SCGC AAA799-E16]KFM17086.1 Transcription initiation factor IIB protein [Marine Group I thaumarchaeote SCGC AAA799-D11]KFM19188.1 Transcription initiation factor IIB protein [Marine Group I thaumarchaeote SCGC RSA3]KFM21903.1 Transcription initiation factor IIB protein [Marine Group I thaumarchaeote SCGC AAA799-B03]
MAGREPAAMAAASAYYSNAIRNDGFTQMQIANASGVTSVTLRNRFHEIREKIQIQKDENSKNFIVFATHDKLNSILEETE